MSGNVSNPNKVPVLFRTGTGYDNSPDDDPEVVEFDTIEEARAFIKGVDMAHAVMEGWVNGWAVAELVE